MTKNEEYWDQNEKNENSKLEEYINKFNLEEYIKEEYIIRIIKYLIYVLGIYAFYLILKLISEF